MTGNSNVGKLVYSTCGRDEGKLFIIIGIIDKDFVYISNGELRPTEKPKKKRLKHLKITDNTAEDIKDILLAGGKVSNSAVKKSILFMSSKEEV